MKEVKEKIIGALKFGLSYILKPFLAAFAFAFAMGRAYERVVVLSSDDYYSKYGSYGYRRR